jgi:hypothetical protein
MAAANDVSSLAGSGSGDTAPGRFTGRNTAAADFGAGGCGGDGRTIFPSPWNGA